MKRAAAVASEGGKTAVKKAKLIQLEETFPKLDYFDQFRDTKVDPENFVKFEETNTKEAVEGLKYILSKDPTLEPYLTKPFHSYLKDVGGTKPLKHYFDSLVSGMISQQISGKAAKAIKQKVIDTLSRDNELPDPEIFDSKSIEELRSCGLSNKKAEFVKRLAKAFIESEEVPPEGVKFSQLYFQTKDDITISLDLQKFKGIGPWSASMFLMFALQRYNIFEVGDLGIRRGATVYLSERPELLAEINAKLKELDLPKLPKSSQNSRYASDHAINCLAHQFVPYKSIWMLLLWRISDTSIDALE
ncbi:hypothetical protein KL942_001250 [Ogataea angusta]|uniref:HhH-GPD domain-containing protein n=1 Tax=Pichia angusta TaxID=870730 RepID=A0ABQ7S118_PICAN|nr:hypothetical protein KL909_001630 [Ogataea angusta]KAG7830524.1 hypothetical protein KL920_002162 [Ogataea angusta]KAG7841371.1 hypothetical protein KL942_001250 [Ogataea angusta]KAG7847855.1 hypothetical protein KL941_002034 [Ogataea angusta]KAG7851052.1 hypothetical protein KL940_001629 [Ogataea angusta]